MTYEKCFRGCDFFVFITVNVIVICLTMIHLPSDFSDKLPNSRFNSTYYAY